MAYCEPRPRSESQSQMTDTGYQTKQAMPHFALILARRSVTDLSFSCRAFFTPKW